MTNITLQAALAKVEDLQRAAEATWVALQGPNFDANKSSYAVDAGTVEGKASARIEAAIVAITDAKKLLDVASKIV
jgi:hypothetical protein